MILNNISVDCVIFGFDGSGLNVLLVKRCGEEDGEIFHDMKLPGSLIEDREDLDDAAKRVLLELTGLKDLSMVQFKAFGSKHRTDDPKDVHWLERAHSLKIDRIVTIAYLAMVKIDSRINSSLDDRQALWMPLSKVPGLAFDHNNIIDEALIHMASMARNSPDILFALLPAKFTIPQLKSLFEAVLRKEMDTRNFYKKLRLSMPYVVQTEETEQGMSHRAARFYRFDRAIFRKTQNQL